jgi:hypothetical protein
MVEDADSLRLRLRLGGSCSGASPETWARQGKASTLSGVQMPHRIIAFTY